MAEGRSGVCQKRQLSFATLAIHAGQDPEQWASKAVIPPIVLSTTFKKPTIFTDSGYEYGRTNNPSRASLEACLAGLERCKHALTFASGMGAIMAVCDLLHPGDHLLTSMDIYGGTIRLFRNSVEKNGIEITYVDFTDLSSVRTALKPNTKMIWLESPTNPLMKVADIANVVAIVRSQQAGALVVVDNTFLTPYFQKPLLLGADIAVYSITKYMNGHSDVIMGSASCNDDGLAKQLRKIQNATGIVPSPFDCYLVNRSLKTLNIRLDRHRYNSLRCAEWLFKQAAVNEVMHPELPTHPQKDITLAQSTGHSGIFSFRHKGGIKETNAFLQQLRVFTIAESLGGYESLAALPCEMSHHALPEEMKQKLGITENLIRLSVGLEDIHDLITDLKQAYDNAFKDYDFNI